ncbi:hypothetical protein BRC93_03385 [Halobacteriales archaeon QS_5_70_15]|nr:MAG: hypothetical protein BRC93_03385 [Halobacteriales archaeon QS_5_70_15]
MSPTRLSFEVDERFEAAAHEWGEARMMEFEEALETKAEQALLEVEHLVAGAHEVEFEVDGTTVRHYPTDELREFLERQAGATGLEPSEVLKLHVDLFARVFLDDDEERPPDAPPT